ATKQEKFVKMKQRNVPIHYGLSALGMTGYSAYCGFMDRGQPKKGDIILVSGAAGGVGSLVVQIAKAIGCGRVVGIAGGKAKCEVVKSLGADDMIDYKNEDVASRVKELLPDGFDVFFDNVGGEILDHALDNMRLGARIVLCGGIAEYALKEPFGPKNYGKLRMKGADMRGFFVYYHAANFEKAETDIAHWINEGKLRALVDMQDGFEQMPSALIGLYTGTNTGKRIVKVSEGAEIVY
ncbi:MAG: NADP-dependent oxidoreductase, partial [Bacteroidota bacterium]